MQRDIKGPIYNVAIIGAGPSGISAAIQLKRYGIEHILLEKEEIGGLLRNANLVENYPGFPKGVPGPELIEIFKKQLQQARVHVDFENVLSLDREEELFLIRTNQRRIGCRRVLIASGTRPRPLSELEISAEIKSHIFYEIHPLMNVSKKRIAIIGAGDAAFDYALNISKKNKVVLINRGKEVRCLPLLWQRAMERKNISYLEETHIQSVTSYKDGLILSCTNPVNRWDLIVFCLVIAVGREPCLDFLSEHLKENLKALQQSRSLYMIGDVKNGIYRQTAIAVGDGIKSAMDIYYHLEESA